MGIFEHHRAILQSLTRVSLRLTGVSLRLTGVSLLAIFQMGAAAALAETNDGPPARATSVEASAAPARDAEWWTERLIKRASIDEEGQHFWVRRLVMLFDGIDLSPDQLAQIDALRAQAQDDRRKLESLLVKQEEAQARGDELHADLLAAEIEEMRTALLPSRQMEQMGAVLSPEQQSIYNMNRAQVYRRSRRPDQ